MVALRLTRSRITRADCRISAAATSLLSPSCLNSITRPEIQQHQVTSPIDSNNRIADPHR